MKALRNFKCNGVKKKSGQELSKEDLEKIGDKFLADLKAKDIISGSLEPLGDPEPSNDEKSDDDSDESDGLDELDREGLFEFASDLGLEPHHRAGEDKLRKLIRDHNKK